MPRGGDLLGQRLRVLAVEAVGGDRGGVDEALDARPRSRPRRRCGLPSRLTPRRLLAAAEDREGEVDDDVGAVDQRRRASRGRGCRRAGRSPSPNPPRPGRRAAAPSRAPRPTAGSRLQLGISGIPISPVGPVTATVSGTIPTACRRSGRGLKAKAGPYYYSWAAISAFYRRYLLQPGHGCGSRSPAPSRSRASPRSPRTPTRFTYFASRPIRVCEGIAIDDGTLSLAVLRARRPARHADPDPAPLQRRSARPPATARSSTSTTSPRRRVTSISETKDGVARPFPLQVDGDYIGERDAEVDAAASTAAAR